MGGPLARVAARLPLCRSPTAVGAVLTAVPFSYFCRFWVVQATPLIGPPMSRAALVTEFEVSR
jgi:hypothetical protein